MNKTEESNEAVQAGPEPSSGSPGTNQTEIEKIESGATSEDASPPTVTQGVAGDTPPPRPEEGDEAMMSVVEAKPKFKREDHHTSHLQDGNPRPQSLPQPTTQHNVAPSPSSTPLGGTVIQGSATDPKVEYEEELLLKWDDHHKSFFELAEDLCHQEQFIGKILYTYHNSKFLTNLYFPPKQKSLLSKNH